MSISPHKILQRLQDLKIWQENHDELFKKTKNLLDQSSNITTESDYHTINGLSAFDSAESSPKVKNWESQVISPVKDFNKLLEEKLAEDPGPSLVSAKPKKPFLRKGSGLERFRLKPSEKPGFTKKTRQNEATKATPLKAPELSIKHRATWVKADEQFSEAPKLAKVPMPGEQTMYEKALEKELLIFEALEQKADSSSFCSTNSSVLRILSSTPSKGPQLPVVEEKRVHWESTTDDDDVIESNLDISEILARLKRIAENRTATVTPIPETSEDEDWTSSDAPSEPSSISSADLEVTLKTEKRNVGVGTDQVVSEGCVICGDKLEIAIVEYKRKIDELMQDKNKIAQMKRNLDQRERNFTKKRREFDEERENHLFEIETEKKKLLKEKQSFQLYMKEFQNRPSKKERTEISNLKQELADLKETCKLKESKNGMSQARLRNQIKQLEKENLTLKDEIEKLTKENAKLNASQKIKRRPSESKILQEINKNITKLTNETLKGNRNEFEREEVHKMDNSLIEMVSHSRKSDAVQCETESKTSEEPGTPQEMCSKDASTRRESILRDGSKQIRYPNGNIKTITPDGNFISVQYYNGDIKETNQILGSVKYFFSQENIWQTTFEDGIELTEFPNGIKEKRHSDGKCEVFLPNNVIQTTFPDGTQETNYSDGSRVHISKSGEKILHLPNGQKEIETKEFKRREYPDGTIKILYPDGVQETRYANGRLRMKDKDGTLIVDTHP